MGHYIEYRRAGNTFIKFAEDLEIKKENSMEHKDFSGEIKSADSENLIVEHVVASEKRDRMGDVLKISGVQVSGVPTVLLQHGMGPYGPEPIGKVLGIRTLNDWKGFPALVGKTEFFNDETGRRIYNKVIQGVMPNFSVGFIPLRWKPFEDEIGGRLIEAWELLEWSVVSTPANALATTLDKSQEAETVCFKFFATDLGPKMYGVHEKVDPQRLFFEDHGKLKPISEIGEFVNERTQRAIRGELRKLTGKVD